jgi:hypothetical protein
MDPRFELKSPLHSPNATFARLEMGKREVLVVFHERPTEARDPNRLEAILKVALCLLAVHC